MTALVLVALALALYAVGRPMKGTPLAGCLIALIVAVAFDVALVTAITGLRKP